MRKKLTEVIHGLIAYNGKALVFPITIISGGARGADSLAEQFAQEYSYVVKIFHAEWDKYGKSAGYRRNIDIVNNCNLLVAFWDGTSRGTKHSIDIATKQGKPVIIFKDWTNA